MPPNPDQPRDRNVPRKNAVREARSASSRPKAFFWVLGAIALIGVAAIGYVATKPKAAPVDVQNIADTSNAGPAQGYLLGKVDAPVKIEEFADFECPGCAGFATSTEPDVRSRIIDADSRTSPFTIFPSPNTATPSGLHAAPRARTNRGSSGRCTIASSRRRDEWNWRHRQPQGFFKRYAGEIARRREMGDMLDARKYRSASAPTWQKA